MQATDDRALLRDYCENQSHDAFAELVTRYINLVYSVALRHVGNPHLAEEITHAVFIILAKKALSLRHDKALSSWLFQATHLTANNLIRSEMRRHRREQEAYMESTLNQTSDDAWKEIAPLLDTAVARLGENDRRAIVLRFYEGRNLHEVGKALGASEESAKKRVARALEKLRRYFFKRGVVSTAAIIASAISANSVHAAPLSLAKSVTAMAVIKGAAASASTLTLIKGALKIMIWTKAKTVIVAGVIVLFAAATTTVTVKEIQNHQSEVWRKKYNPDIMRKLSPRVEIFPALPLRFGDSYGDNDYGRMGLGASMMDMLESAHEYKYSQARIIAATPLPRGNYDFMANLTNGSAQALQQQINRQFGLVERYQVIETNAYLLTLRNPHAPELKPTKSRGYNVCDADPDTGSFRCVNQPVSVLARFLEDALRTPVIDQTGLTNHYDIKFAGDSDPEKLKQTVLNEVGLELVPGQAPVEMLMVDKAQ
jgi:uncharacterized protein (TIGR03435 family)